VAGMKWFQNTFTRRINCRHQRWGHVFGGRYKAILVQTDGPGDYLRTLIDYVHLNPARAGLIDLASKGGLLAYRWSSLTTAYAVLPANRPPWMETSIGFAVAGTLDDASGRRALIDRLEERIRGELAERCGLPPGPEPSLAVTLHRGWYWGNQAFAEAILERFRDVGNTHRNRNYPSSQQGKDRAVVYALRLLRSGMKLLGMDVATLRKTKGSEPQKVLLAQLLHDRTTVSLKWIAQRLFMRSASNVSQQLRRMKIRGLTRSERSVWRRLSRISG
jgi:putative transposase